jgi:hypothetical protein
MGIMSGNTAKQSKVKTNRSRSYYALSDEALKMLASKDDSGAKVALEMRLKIRAMTADEPKIFPIPMPSALEADVVLGCHVVLNFRKAYDDSVRMYIAVDADVTRQDLGRHWDEIVTWRRLLRSWQGMDRTIHGVDDHFYFGLHVSNKEGASYARLAHRLNAAMAEEVADGWIDDVYYTLGLMHITKEDTLKWYKDARSRLADGLSAFPSKDVPVSGERVREVLRYWRIKNKDWLMNS